MTRGFSIAVVDPDDEYTDVEIQAYNDHFAGSARLYAALGELTELAEKLVSCPSRNVSSSDPSHNQETEDGVSFDRRTTE